MKICVLGSDGNNLCQVPALRKGFEELGHIVTKDISDLDVAFVFSGNPWYDEIWNHKLMYGKTKKTIFNVLDVPVHCYDFDYDKMAARLVAADKVTCISKFVRGQVKDFFNIDAEVIYYPMKPVWPNNNIMYPEAKVLCAGRLGDPNKRFNVAIAALIRAGYSENQVATIGPEQVNYGVYHGMVSDDKLRDLYNSVDYVMMPSRIEGIGLPAIEAACAGAIPIVLPDLSTYDEFWAASPMGPYYSTFTSIDSIASFIMYMDNHPAEKQDMKNAMLQYAELYLRSKFDNVEVAKRIINVFHSIP